MNDSSKNDDDDQILRLYYVHGASVRNKNDFLSHSSAIINQNNLIEIDYHSYSVNSNINNDTNVQIDMVENSECHIYISIGNEQPCSTMRLPSALSSSIKNDNRYGFRVKLEFLDNDLTSISSSHRFGALVNGLNMITVSKSSQHNHNNRTSSNCVPSPVRDIVKKKRWLQSLRDHNFIKLVQLSSNLFNIIIRLYKHGAYRLLLFLNEDKIKTIIYVRVYPSQLTDKRNLNKVSLTPPVSYTKIKNLTKSKSNTSLSKKSSYSSSRQSLNMLSDDEFRFSKKHIIVNDDAFDVSTPGCLFKKFGENGRGIGQFSNPQDVCFYDNNSLLVSDSINQCVQLFDIETGNLKSLLFDKKHPIRGLRRPIGLASSPDGTILVADYDQRCIGVLQIDGQLIRRFGEQQLVGPKGVVLSSHSGIIAVVDNKANSICLFHSNGKFSHRFGTHGPENHQIAGPHYAAFHSIYKDDNIIVTDFYNSCVKIFDINIGQVLSTFGSNGTKQGQFQGPTGLTTDNEHGMIFVSDWGNNRMQVMHVENLTSGYGRLNYWFLQ
ncbi:unnamed protein product [Didymodactylos carnosus]|uniref:Uncharacterized protein n=1 Tax=Didymodactylos carnosus TaxID=1234261 RepID=A0A815KHN9_9BILA|nr:unnamed protein product [Didymodactylos carnosus]CAF4287731.1 unnamed protein product [Didymodactylos carnosus]